MDPVTLPQAKDPDSYPTVTLARVGNATEFDTYTLRLSIDAMEYLNSAYGIDIFEQVNPESIKGIAGVERACKILCGAISDQARIPYEEMRKRVDLRNMPAIGAAIAAAISKVPTQAVTTAPSPLPVQ